MIGERLFRFFWMLQSADGLAVAFVYSDFTFAEQVERTVCSCKLHHRFFFQKPAEGHVHPIAGFRIFPVLLQGFSALPGAGIRTVLRQKCPD